MLAWKTGCLTFSREVPGDKIVFQVTHLRVTIAGDDDDRRISTMTLGFGESSIFEVFCRIGRCCGESFIGDVHFPRLVASRMFRRLLDVRARRRKKFQGFLIGEYAHQMTRRHG